MFCGFIIMFISTVSKYILICRVATVTITNINLNFASLLGPSLKPII